MKLRTDIEHVKTIVAGLPGDIWAHDALAAHALMQATDEWIDWPGYYTDEMMSLGGVVWARKRADELMREWTTSEPSSSQP